MNPEDDLSRWLYEPDQEPKRKHHWREPKAGFVTVGLVPVGKCPNVMTLADAQGLLDHAVPWHPARWEHSYPKRLYAVLNGVVYRATPTNPGVSYHGFPEHPASFPTGGNAREVKAELIARAKDLECEREVRQWMNW